jgi:hypothetical protein
MVSCKFVECFWTKLSIVIIIWQQGE